MIAVELGGVQEVAIVAAHCDDAAIGAGATMLAMASQRAGLHVRVLVLTGGGTVREDEERRALSAFLPGAEITVSILDLPDGRLPERWGDVKGALQDLAAGRPAELVLAPQRGDAHQDHRLLAELVPTAFRDQLILGYEIAKWESDLPRTNLYQPVSAARARHKADLIAEHYPSQMGHDWFDREAFLGLMRVRGTQSRTGYAEAFVAEKLVLAEL